jgi:5-methylcytosine-specific restriction endonuclease McrA
VSSERKRKPISDAVRHLVLAEAGYKCANPRCRNVLALELHHVVWVKDGGPNNVENLLALCGHCHGLHTLRHIHASAIATWKSLLQSLNNPNRASADLLLVLYEEEQAETAQNHIPFCFTATVSVHSPG